MSKLKIRKMSQETGIQISEIREALDLGPSKGLIASMASMRERLHNAHTIQEVERIYSTCHNGELRQKIVEKWELLCLAEVKSAFTIKELYDIYEEAPYVGNTRPVILEKVHELACKELAKISNCGDNCEDFESLYGKVNSFLDTAKTKELILKRWIACASTYDEIKHVFQTTSRAPSYLHQSALEKFKQALKEKVESAQTAEELSSIYKDIPYYEARADLKNIVIRKLALLY